MPAASPHILARSTVFQHLLFWLIGAVVLRISLTQAYPAGVTPPTQEIVLRILLHIIGIGAAVYFNLRVLIPRLFEQKRYGAYLLSVLATLVGGAFLIAGLYRLVYLGGIGGGIRVGPLRPFVLVVFFIQTAVFVIASSLLHFVKEWVVFKDAALELAELERKKLEAELLALRAQINPHFLFNALNNIYALSLDASPKTPDIILKLSDLMRYILYECRTPRVDLEKELAFVENYLEVERLRVSDDVEVCFNTVGHLAGQQVAPLLFMPLIENAFKHGVGSQVDGAFVHILMQYDQPDQLTFEIENSKEAALVRYDADDPYHGVGLTNVRKRLQLLYPEAHTFDIQDTEQLYRVHLTLPTT